LKINLFTDGCLSTENEADDEKGVSGIFGTPLPVPNPPTVSHLPPQLPHMDNEAFHAGLTLAFKIRLKYCGNKVGLK